MGPEANSFFPINSSMLVPSRAAAVVFAARMVPSRAESQTDSSTALISALAFSSVSRKVFSFSVRSRCALWSLKAVLIEASKGGDPRILGPRSRTR